MSPATLSLVAVNAGLGDPSSTRLLVDRLIEATADEFAGRPAAELSVEVIDLRDLAVDIARSLTTGFAVGDLRAALDAVHGAHGLIVATPVFNASYSGLFKSFFDLVDVDRMQGTPVLIGATGGSPRHSMVLDHAVRPLFSYLRAVVLPTGVYAAAEDWAGTSGDTALLSDRIRRAARELATAVRATENIAGVQVSVRGSEGSEADASSGGPFGEVARRSALEAAGIANFAKLLGDNH
ncbi:CE1759 family FMN reductase [Gordonia insulae]|uniref:FMN reductase (NADPH) n=1 Tax=Gordonia insulae TaxID=2420509 RepID=A0A3G8JTW7_9ACTN|nr:CE1759 family FMN reductase [Gordonia insulae]AZG48363.1 FMN reductase (NADPH) [Gordonia insulae]